ncbi:hypothetical protein BD769DRAFT_1393437 [Suillus cothurnatus]|nr:hypothetical protein BD769DRAFT_1393437 [Suillus cothurnatus]
MDVKSSVLLAVEMLLISLPQHNVKHSDSSCIGMGHCLCGVSTTTRDESKWHIAVGVDWRLERDTIKLVIKFIFILFTIVLTNSCVQLPITKLIITFFIALVQVIPILLSIVAFIKTLTFAGLFIISILLVTTIYNMAGYQMRAKAIFDDLLQHGRMPNAKMANPSLEVCPNFEGNLYEDICNDLIAATGATAEEVVARLTEMWTHGHNKRIQEWNQQWEEEAQAEAEIK